MLDARFAHPEMTFLFLPWSGTDPLSPPEQLPCGRREQTTAPKFHICTRVKMIALHYIIWNHHGKCIQISTNMPCIGFVMSEIAFEMLRILIKPIWFEHVKTNGRELKPVGLMSVLHYMSRVCVILPIDPIDHEVIKCCLC